MRRILVFVVVAATTLAIALPAAAAPVHKGKLTISGVWARSTPQAADTGAVYLTIRNTGKTDHLVFASVPKRIAGHVELHETVPADGSDTGMGMLSRPRHGDDADSSSTTTSTPTEGDGATTMQPVTAIELPRGTTRLEPGGYHIMLIELAAPLTKGEKFPVTLTFDSIGKVKVTAVVRDR